MNISSKPKVFSILVLLFILGSVGIQHGNNAQFVLLKILLAVYIFGVFMKRNVIISNNVLFLSLLFLVFSLISLTQSVDIGNSFNVVGELIILLGVMFYATNSPKQLEKYLPDLLIITGLILAIYSLILSLFSIPFLVPTDGYQLVFSRFGSHNHLGDFLVLPMLACLYLIAKKGKLKYLLPFLFFFPFFLFSYSRSAYLSFFLPGLIFLLILFWKSKSKIKLIIPALSFATVVSFALLFFVSTVFESKYVPVLKPVNEFLVKNFNLKFKHFGANRLEYFNTAFQSIKEKPYFGVGPGNFVYASAKYSNIPNYRTHSSHNIFLDVFAEFGVFAFISFSWLMILVIKVAMRHPSVYTLLFFALLINFQTDYTFRIFSVALLFFLIIGIIIRKNET